MALSEEEQRLLDQMEAALAAEDPRLASTLRGSQRLWYRRRFAISSIIFVVGIVVLVVGMEVHPAVSVVGFLMMLGAAVVGVTAWREPGSGGGSPPVGGNTRRPETGFLGRPDDRRRSGDDES